MGTFQKGDAITIHYPHASYPAVINAVGVGDEKEDGYHIVMDGGATWATPDGPIISFEATLHTPDHERIMLEHGVE